MKKNIFKKVVASLATAAMAVGMLATTPAQEVKAADKETEIVLVLSGETTADKILLDFDGQDAGITASGTVDTSVGWGRDMYTFTQDASDSTRYTIKVQGTVEDPTYCNMQFLFVTGSDVKGYKYYPQNGRDVFNNNDTIYVQIDLSADNWTTVSASENDPNAAKPEDIMSVIDAIGTVELTTDCLNKIKAAESAYNTFSGDKSAVTNYSTLTAARAKWNELIAAGAGTLTIYVKNADWSDMYVYGWDGADFGTWPGKELTALKNNTGWYSCSFEINSVTNLIFNSKTAGTQTIDWNYVSANTYWITLGEKTDDGKYLVNSSNVSTEAPAGWKSEEAEKVEVVTTTPAATESTTQKETTTVPVAVDKTEVEKIAAAAIIKNAPADTSLNITSVSDDAAKTVETFKSTTLKNMKFQTLEITLVKTGTTEAVQPGTAVEITIPVMESLKSAKVVEVFRVDGDKLTSLGKVDVVDGQITFSTDHFSTYVFAAVSTSTNTGDMASITMMLAVAAMAGVAVLAMRKKAVNE